MNQLDLFASRKARDSGIKKAIDHAGKHWAESAYNHFLRFLDGIPQDRRFRTEQFREYAYGKGLSRPPHERSFGAITVRMVRENRIIRVGYEQVSNPTSNCALASVWRKI